MSRMGICDPRLLSFLQRKIALLLILIDETLVGRSIVLQRIAQAIDFLLVELEQIGIGRASAPRRIQPDLRGHTPHLGKGRQLLVSIAPSRCANEGLCDQKTFVGLTTTLRPPGDPVRHCEGVSKRLVQRRIESGAISPNCATKYRELLTDSV